MYALSRLKSLPIANHQTALVSPHVLTAKYQKDLFIQAKSNPPPLRFSADFGMRMLSLVAEHLVARVAVRAVDGVTDGIRNSFTSNPSIENNIDRTVINLHISSGNSSQDGLWSAIIKGHVECVKRLIAAGHNVNALSDEGFTPLHTAARYGHTEIMKLLIDNGADIHKKSSGGDVCSKCEKHTCNGIFFSEPRRTIIHRAVIFNQPKAIQLLLDHGAKTDLEVYDCEKNLPLLSAARHGQTEIIKMLVDGGADIDVKRNDWHYHTALHRAVSFSQPETVKLLLRLGANPLIKREDGKTALDLARSEGKSGIISILQEAELNVKALLKAAEQEDVQKLEQIAQSSNILPKGAADAQGNTLFHIALKKRNKAIFEWLLKNDFPFHKKNNAGETPLDKAVDKGHAEFINTLRLLMLFRAASIGDKTQLQNIMQHASSFSLLEDEEGNNVLHKIMDKKYHLDCITPIVNELIKNGANIHKKNNNGKTPLDLATEEGFIELVSTLKKDEQNAGFKAIEEGNLKRLKQIIENIGSLPKWTDSQNNPLLHVAVDRGENEIATWLIEQGANLSKKNDDGNTAMDLALENDDDYEMIRSLQKAELFQVVKQGRIPKLRKLIADGVRIDEKNKDGCTPLHLAMFDNHPEMSRVLLKELRANPNIQNDKGHTALHTAALEDNLAILDLILEYPRILINQLDRSGKTALYYARKNLNLEMIKVLEGHGATCERIIESDSEADEDENLFSNHRQEISLAERFAQLKVPKATPGKHSPASKRTGSPSNSNHNSGPSY